ncbi:MAG: asparagine synthase (glutamine-hydrolyzing) [Aureliella sp.]
MCGIAGIVDRDAPRIGFSLRRMVAAQKHRGPDGDGATVINDGSLSIALGHSRLAILDLSPAGAQPLVHPVTGDVLIFNGEVYNFLKLRSELEALGCSFSGHSDSEVLLHALVQWDTAALDRIEGMFAFAFYRCTTRSLLLARDPLGIKPLYMAYAKERLIFASEVRAILASGLVSRAISRRGLASYLAYGAVQEPDTIWESVCTLPAGHYCKVQLGTDALQAPLRPQAYWSIPRIDEACNESIAVERVRSTLIESVRDHLVSDVPVGVFLSSGIDSTLVAGLASRLKPDVRSFTVSFPEDSQLDESGIAAESAALLGIAHVNVPVLSDMALKCVSDWFEHLDSPSMDGLNVFVISRAVRAEGITVALSGQGGDELFGGYPSFTDVPRVCRARKLLDRLPKAVIRNCLNLALRNKSLAYREKAFAMFEASNSVLSIYLQRRRTLSDAQLKSLGVTAADYGLSPDFLPQESLLPAELQRLDAREQVSLFESRYYMGNMLLHDGDANGMANSLEIRVPFLDSRMLQLAYSIPGNIRFPKGRPPKHMLRHAFPDLLNGAVLRQKKRGFALPVKRWMSGVLKERCEESIRALSTHAGLDARGVDHIWQAYLAEPDSPIWSRAWQLSVLGDYLVRWGSADTPVLAQLPR